MQKGTRSIKTTTHINTWIAECDDLPKEEQMQLIEKAPIKPSCVIESKSSYHIYYFAKDATRENREQVNRWLREYYHWDQSICSDLSRILRLPWTNHNKTEPYKITCLYLDQTYYTEKEMLQAFPYEKQEKLKYQSVIKPVHKARNLREVMARQSNKYMLDRVSRSSLVKWEDIEYKDNKNWTHQIYVNWESTWSWIDASDFIGSTKNWWPTWIQRCEFYWNTKSDIAKRFTEFCSDLIPKDIDRTKQAKEIQTIQQEEMKNKIMEDRGAKLKHIDYSEKTDSSFNELINTNPYKVMKRWREEWDNYLWWIYWGKIYLIGADTWVWKSTFVNQVAKNLSHAWHRVARYSLEDRMEDIGKEDIYYMTNKIRRETGKHNLDWIKYINWEYTYKWHENYNPDILKDIIQAVEILRKNTNIIELDKKKEVTIDDLIALMEEECDKGTRAFIIDHLHYFQYENSKDRMDLQIEHAMQAINEVARKRDVAIFLIAHYNSTWWNGTATINSFKGSTAIKQIANIVIQLSRTDYWQEETIFKISKLRCWPIKPKDIICTFDIKTFEYSFTKTQEQNKKEKAFTFSK